MKVQRQGMRSVPCFRSAHLEKVKPPAGHVLPCALSLVSTHATTFTHQSCELVWKLLH